MTLYFIGIGLCDEKDISVKGLEIVKKADVVYLENYTSVLLNWHKAENIKNHTNSMSSANSKRHEIRSNNNVLCYRKNAILLGDSIDDAKIIAGSNFDCVIKIGFLNYDVDELLDAYSKNFDVLILNDSSLDYINNLLKEITI